MTPQELVESILWNALQGKITQQYDYETTDEVIGNLRLSPISENERYFDIPSNWKWAKIGDIFELVNGNAFKPNDWSETGTPIVRIQNLNDKNAPYNYCNFRVEDKYYLHGGELLFSWSGTPGTSFGAFIWEGSEAVLNQHIFIVKPRIKIDYAYAKYALNGEIKVFIDKAHGGAGLKHITKKDFDECSLPIPPLTEQKRIVAKIEELLPLLDRYEKAWTRLEDFNQRFPQDIQKSILQQAIQGKLVEQRAEEVTGEELYLQIQNEKQKLIREGKIKKEKPLPDITDEEIPFEIPESWKWVRLGSLIQINSGKGLTSSQMIEGNIPVYGGNGITGYHNEYLVSKRTVVIGRVGFYCGSVHITEEKAWITDNAFITTYPEDHIDMAYLVYMLRHMDLGANNNATAQPVVSGKKIYPLLFPLPPLAEQKRIAAKLDEILPFCDKLK